MSEQGMRQKVVKALAKLNAMSVENPALPGTPDVNYAEGWIELKWLRAWPSGEDTPVRFDHWTPQQRLWHLRRRKVGGRSWVLVQCRREWLLLDGADAALHLNSSTRSELCALSANHWPNGLVEEELREWVSRTQRNFSLTAADVAKLKQRPLSGSESL